MSKAAPPDGQPPPTAGEVIHFNSKRFVRRQIDLSARCRIICDALPEDDLEIQYVRWAADAGSEPASFTFSGPSTGLQSDARMGTVFTRGAENEVPALWSPRGVVVARPDAHGRLAVAADREIESWWELGESPKFHLDLEREEGLAVYWPMVVFGEATATRIADLLELESDELRRLMKADWFNVSSVADLWRYLIDGSVYDPRDGGHGRFRSQQCAFAWWSYLTAMHRRTGKPHCRSLASAVAWSVLLDLEEDGAWRHGFWQADPEIHARFFWDGVRVLLAEHELRPDPLLAEGAVRAGEFALDHLSDSLAGNKLWLLHDSLELKKKPRHTAATLGKSPNNTLCLNTHVQGLCVLHRLRDVDDPGSAFGTAYERGVASLAALLAMRTSSLGGRLFDRTLPAILASKVPRGLPEHVLRFLVFRFLAPLYWRLRSSVPGLVFPSGYVDRDLGATMLADEYHAINVKDLLELSRLDPRDWLRITLADAVGFTESLDFRRALERSPMWAEWADVVAALESEPAISVRRTDEVEQAVRETFDASTFDAFCCESGLWPVIAEEKSSSSG